SVATCNQHSFPTRRSSDLCSPIPQGGRSAMNDNAASLPQDTTEPDLNDLPDTEEKPTKGRTNAAAQLLNLVAEMPLYFTEDGDRSEEHTSELQSPDHLVCR